jgi:hypothetical protein
VDREGPARTRLRISGIEGGKTLHRFAGQRQDVLVWETENASLIEADICPARPCRHLVHVSPDRLTLNAHLPVLSQLTLGVSPGLAPG